MSRVALALGCLILFSAVEAAPRYSGTIVAVDSGGSSITLNELGAGVPGGRNQEIPHVIRLSPGTKILLATRAADSEETGWQGGYAESPIAATDLKPGDFATVEAETRDGKLVAISVVVVRPTAEPR
jgi:hypothetical protein